jgi:plasmid stabilization system protein ParE
MKSRFVLSPEAVEDLASIWRYIQTQSSTEIADRVESTIPGPNSIFGAQSGRGSPTQGPHETSVRFFPVYSYLVVYRTETKPLQVVAILHGRCEVERVLQKPPS